MDKNNSINESKYLAVSKLLGISKGKDDNGELLHSALDDISKVLGISAASIVIIDKKGEEKHNVRYGDDMMLEILTSLEEQMINSVRKQFGVENIFSTLDKDGEKSLFSYLVKVDGNRLGAISGICDGGRNIALEEQFISTLAIALQLLFGQSIEIEAARLKAVKQAVVTLNHEINNPLTAVLGNVQLLLMKDEDLPEEIIDRLKMIESSSLRIRDVINNLMKISELRATIYIDDTEMIDISDKDSDQSE